MADAISLSRNSVIEGRNFRVLDLAAVYVVDLLYMQMDINRHLNSYSHGVKIQVKQVDDNKSWLYNKTE